jgi:drug/metabolite transporter (DMT)-like permease
MSPVRKGVIALIVANVIWGAASPIFKLSLSNIPPFTLAFLRFFFASILLGLFLNRRLKFPALKGREGLYLILYALTGITLNIVFYFLGLKLTVAMNAPVIISSQPIMTFLFSFAFLGETFNLRKFMGMLLGTFGILAIILEPLIEKGMDGSITGNLALIAATAAAAVATIIGHRIFTKHDPLVLLFWAFIIAASTFLPLAALEYRNNPGLYAALNTNGYLGIFYGAVFSSTVAYSCFCWGLSKIPATDASMFAYVDPVAGTILAWFLLHEPVTLPFILGAAAIFGGIFIAEGRIHYHPIHRLRR